jgi:hypothetical protein
MESKFKKFGSRYFLLSKLFPLGMVLFLSLDGFARVSCNRAILGSTTSINDITEPNRKWFEVAIQGEQLLDYTWQLIRRGFQENSSNKDVLERVFGVVFGKNAKVPPVMDMLNSYQTYMNGLIKSGLLSESNVLMPVFVVNENGILKTVKLPSEIPAGGEIVAKVPTELFHEILARGEFPITPDLLIHDLAHLTGFIVDRDYMSRVRQLSVSKVQNTNAFYSSRAAREFFFNENLFLVRSSALNQLLPDLKLTDKMKSDFSKVKFKEMKDYLGTIPYPELLAALSKIQDNFLELIVPLGGAARDPLCGQTAGSTHNHPLRRMIFDENTGRYDEIVDVLARVQTILLRLSHVSVDDWYSALGTPNLDPQSPISRLFAEPEMWTKYPNLYLSFSSPNYEKDH